MYDILGSTWCAILVAGFDSEERKAEAFKKDVQDVKNILSSKDVRAFLME